MPTPCIQEEKRVGDTEGLGVGIARMVLAPDPVGQPPAAEISVTGLGPSWRGHVGRPKPVFQPGRQGQDPLRQELHLGLSEKSWAGLGWARAAIRHPVLSLLSLCMSQLCPELQSKIIMWQQEKNYSFSHGDIKFISLSLHTLA